MKTYNEAIQLLQKYNDVPFHMQHGLTVSKSMGWFATHLGHAAEQDFWEQVGLLHDIDFEKWPEAHCVKALDLLSEEGYDASFIHAVVSHGWPMCTDVKPEHEMEKVLNASDELTGLIGAAALMRPSKSTKDMELKSVKKKFKDKKFAAGCDREVIKRGAELLGWELDELLQKTLESMQETEDAVNAEMEKLGLA